MTTIILIAVASVISFIAGVLVGRKNAKTVTAITSTAVAVTNDLKKI